ncbi:MAG: hypothetical protein D6808_01475 [Candidatus Dadabacteria bacterium]|nr:MAG: hypothetical protein D6808_01475 [Candidatus Dadabacteria bacterium]
MLQIKINGESSQLNGTGLPTLADVVELIKGSIDPAHIITNLQINGRDLTESDWNSSPSRLETEILEVETCTPEQFVDERMEIAASLVENTYILFRSARQAFQAGDMEEGNRCLMAAVNDLKAFFEWYNALLQIMPESERSSYTISQHIDEISEICKEICQQQVYQSWWALGNSIRDKLEPALDKLECFLRKLWAQRKGAEASPQ